jgi:hypothetical protein
VTAQTPSSRRWLPRLIVRSAPVTRHQVFWGVGLQHVGCASAQRSHAPSVAAVRTRVGRFAVPPLSIVASHLPTFAIRRLVRDALELSPLNDQSSSLSRSASHRSPRRLRQSRYSAASHCQRPHTRHHLLESEEVLRLLPFALCFAPRGAELRQLAYTRAVHREFRCTSINGVCSESPARNGLRPPARNNKRLAGAALHVTPVVRTACWPGHDDGCGRNVKRRLSVVAPVGTTCQGLPLVISFCPCGVWSSPTPWRRREANVTRLYRHSHSPCQRGTSPTRITLS